MSTRDTAVVMGPPVRISFFYIHQIKRLCIFGPQGTIQMYYYYYYYQPDQLSQWLCRARDDSAVNTVLIIIIIIIIIIVVVVVIVTGNSLVLEQPQLINY